jgi:hypothetical protein
VDESVIAAAFRRRLMPVAVRMRTMVMRLMTVAVERMNRTR